MRRSAASCLAVLLTSCGTLFNGSTQAVSFSSEPPGAKVLVNGLPLGTTPFQMSLDSRRNQNVEFKLDGYESRVVVVTSSLEGGWLVLDIVPGLLLWVIPLVVDAATGNWNGLEMDHVHAVLEPVKRER